MTWKVGDEWMRKHLSYSKYYLQELSVSDSRPGILCACKQHCILCSVNYFLSVVYVWERREISCRRWASVGPWETSEKNKDLVHTTLWCEHRYFWCEKGSDFQEKLSSHQLNFFHSQTILFQTWHGQLTPGGVKHTIMNDSFHWVWQKRIIFEYSYQYGMLYTIVVHSHQILWIHLARFSYHF